VTAQVDSSLVQHWPGGAASLRAVVAEHKDPDEGAFAHAAWAEKSCRIMATEGFYPAGHKLDAGYGQRWSKTLVQQMAAAARRLAAALNRSPGWAVALPPDFQRPHAGTEDIRHNPT
jgi:hypothetical protein